MEPFTKHHQIEGFCESSRLIVERFILECKKGDLLPSYYFFATWMEDSAGSRNTIKFRSQDTASVG